MSTADFTTLRSSGGTVPTETIRRGSSKGWLNLNGSGTIATRDSFNTSSVTDNGAGDYTQNFTTAHPTANYIGVCTCGQGAGSSLGRVTIAPSGAAPTSSAYRVRVLDTGFTVLGDTDHLSVEITG